MSVHPRLLTSVATAFLLALATPHAHAIIVLTSSDGSTAGQNTSAPTGPLADQGWQYMAKFGSFSAVPVDSTHFLTATHNGTQSSLTYDGTTYTSSNGDYHLVGSEGDLAVFELLNGNTFSTWAPIYTGGNEIGKSILAIGRGVAPGAPLYQPEGDTTKPVVGWRWGSNPNTLSWGTNTVSDIVDDPNLGELLYFTFDRDAGINEGTAASADSGGGIFINGQLAGIISGVDGRFSYSETGSLFNAALLDARSFWLEGTPRFFIDPDDFSSPVPSGTYASRIDSAENLALLRSLGIVPEPGSLLLLGLGLAVAGAWGVHRRKS